MLAIVDEGANIYLSKQVTTTVAAVMMSNEMIARLIYGSKIESSHIATLQISGLSKSSEADPYFPKN